MQPPIMTSSFTNGKVLKNPLFVSDIRDKIDGLEAACHALLQGCSFQVPHEPARDLRVLPIKELPPKVGLSKPEGQARLIHDLASIELQAMELALRTLIEFPNAPLEFRKRLVEVALDEARHLRACLEVLEDLKFSWGSFPVHTGLWQATDSGDSLLDRILIVHRYLEGSGLDAGETLLRRLRGVQHTGVKEVIQMITDEELGHVQFGSQWYREICRLEKVDPEKDFGSRLEALFHKIPRRLEPIQKSLRLKAGFSESEIDALERLQMRWRANSEERIHPGA